VTVGLLATAQLAGAATFPGWHWPGGQGASGYPSGGHWGWPPANPAPPNSTGASTSPNRSTPGFSSSDRWASYPTGGYTISNDVWGNGSGSQKLWATSPSNWGVSSTQPNTPGVKSYPNVSKSIGAPLNSLSSATSSFSQSLPSVGDWESAYDIWLNGSRIEVMVWTNKHGNVGPLGSPVNTVSLDGKSWTLYAGSNGSNPTYSFVLSGNETSSTVNLLNLLKYLENAKHYFSNPTLSTIQYGFEISSTNNIPQNFAINNYSASAF
jgi:hypothetical protein